jgi:hypothetical protein
MCKRQRRQSAAHMINHLLSPGASVSEGGRGPTGDGWRAKALATRLTLLEQAVLIDGAMQVFAIAFSEMGTTD